MWGVVWCTVLSCTVVFCAVVWCGVVWCGGAGYDVEWCGMVCRGLDAGAELDLNRTRLHYSLDVASGMTCYDKSNNNSFITTHHTNKRFRS